MFPSLERSVRAPIEDFQGDPKVRRPSRDEYRQTAETGKTTHRRRKMLRSVALAGFAFLAARRVQRITPSGFSSDLF